MHVEFLREKKVCKNYEENEEKMKTLTLSLKKQWFDMIKAGVKKEEYRRFGSVPKGLLELKEIHKILYWNIRLIKEIFLEKGKDQCTYRFNHFDLLVFTLGYPPKSNTERRLTFKNPKIRIGTGRPEWGAEPGKMYFVISWEE